MNVAKLFERAAARNAAAPALARGTRPISSYGDLVDRAARLASGVTDTHGVRPGDRLAVVMSNHERYVEVMLACWWGGFAPVPINAKLHPTEIAFLLEDAGARLVFTDTKLSDTAVAAVGTVAAAPAIVDVDQAGYGALVATTPAAMVDRAADDLAWLFYTSGTTGRPKGAMITHRNLRAMTYAYFMSVDHIGPTDAIIHAAPLSHGSGLYMLPHGAAGAVQVVPDSGGFEAREVFDLLPHYPGTTMFCAPTMVRRLTAFNAEDACDTRNLKTIVYGGAPMYLADLQAAERVFGNKLAQIYGQGESPMTITALDKHGHAAAGHPRHVARLQSAGTAQAVCDVAIGDDTGRVLPPGTLGEIMVRGDSVIPGYWQNPEATAKAQRRGWWCTGDVGVMDEDGFLTLKDRSKDVVISGGSNVYPREVEEVLLTHPAVREVSVIGRPDPEWGEVVIAIVVRGDDDADEAALDAHCLAHIARFKRPKAYVFVDELPKSAYGKILKTELRRLYG
ncbi:MAG: AMP-binding protein [Pseudomonadota bacterium]